MIILLSHISGEPFVLDATDRVWAINRLFLELDARGTWPKFEAKLEPPLGMLLQMARGGNSGAAQALLALAGVEWSFHHLHSKEIRL